MPKGIQKSVPKLAIVGLLALLAFNYPILSLFRGHLFSIPTLYFGLFGAWLLVIWLARAAADPQRRSTPRSALPVEETKA
ncbi:MAG: hypothetical protein FGM35_04830 [Rhodocyclaceae bacterium]|nr:hypothetical protein [Rhodocyclaceae bacterium]